MKMDDHLTAAYAKTFFKDGWAFIMEKNQQSFTNPMRLVCLFTHYVRLVQVCETLFLNMTPPTEINIFDNDDTLCDTITLVNMFKKENQHLKSPYSRAETLPTTFHKMVDYLQLFYNASVLSLVCTGRKVEAEDIGDKKMEEIHQEIYDAYISNNEVSAIPNSMAQAIAKKHYIPTELVFTNIFNSFVPDGFHDEISNEIHKAFVIYLLIRLYPNAILNQYDDQLKALQLGYFGFICAKQDLESEAIQSNAQLHLYLVNLKNEEPVNKLDYSTFDINHFICFQSAGVVF